MEKKYELNCTKLSDFFLYLLNEYIFILQKKTIVCCFIYLSVIRFHFSCCICAWHGVSIEIVPRPFPYGGIASNASVFVWQLRCLAAISYGQWKESIESMSWYCIDRNVKRCTAARLKYQIQHFAAIKTSFHIHCTSSVFLKLYLQNILQQIVYASAAAVRQAYRICN